MVAHSAVVVDAKSVGVLVVGTPRSHDDVAALEPSGTRHLDVAADEVRVLVSSSAHGLYG